MGDGGTGRLEDEKEMLPDKQAESLMKAAWERVNSLWSYGTKRVAEYIPEMPTSARVPVDKGMAGQAARDLTNRRTMYEDLDEELKK